jgi:hypothetical protein
LKRQTSIKDSDEVEEEKENKQAQMVQYVLYKIMPKNRKLGAKKDDEDTMNYSDSTVSMSSSSEEEDSAEENILSKYDTKSYSDEDKEKKIKQEYKQSV